MKVAGNIEVLGTLKVNSVPTQTGAPFVLVRDANGNVRQMPNTFSSPTVYQIAEIFGQNVGVIALNSFIGNDLGSYSCRIDAQFADLSNGAYRLIAQRTIDFSFVAFQSGAAIAHTEPVLQLSSHSGLIVRLSDNVVFDLNAQDIDFETAIVSNKLVVRIKNNLANSVIPAANGSIRCRYTLNLNKWNWNSGGIENIIE